MKVREVDALVQRLKENRLRYLVRQPICQIVRAISDVSRKWLRPNYSFRVKAEKELVSQLGLSPLSAREGMNHLFGELTSEKLLLLLKEELGDPRALDDFVAMGRSHYSKAIGPSLTAHLFPGNVFAPSVMSLVMGLLVKSSNLGKCSSDDTVMPFLFAESLKKENPKLGRSVEVVTWKGGSVELEKVVFSNSEAVIAYGSDESIQEIRSRIPPHVRFIGYGHRVSLAVILKSVLIQRNLDSLIKKSVFDIQMYNQMGCLSPQSLFVEKGGEISVEEFAERLQVRLIKKRNALPLPFEARVRMRSLQEYYEVQKVSGKKIKIFGEHPHEGMVFYDEKVSLKNLSVYGRAVVVSGFSRRESLSSVLQERPFNLQAVGLAASRKDYREFADFLSRTGVSRICPLGSMQRPPITWHHDGMDNLRPLIRWVDLE